MKDDNSQGPVTQDNSGPHREGKAASPQDAGATSERIISVHLYAVAPASVAEDELGYAIEQRLRQAINNSVLDGDGVRVAGADIQSVKDYDPERYGRNLDAELAYDDANRYDDPPSPTGP